MKDVQITTPALAAELILLDIANSLRMAAGRPLIYESGPMSIIPGDEKPKAAEVKPEAKPEVKPEVKPKAEVHKKEKGGG